MKHLAPTIVIEAKRTDAAEIGYDQIRFITLLPSVEPTDIHPLGEGQPSYQRNSVMLNTARAEQKRTELYSAHYESLDWAETPEYIKTLMWNELGWENWTQHHVNVWVKGSLPTDRIDRDDAEGDQ